jgi:WD40 repeat protein
LGADGRYVATYQDTIITSSVDKSLKLIDYATGEVSSRRHSGQTEAEEADGKVDRVLEPHKAAVLTFAVHPLNPRYILTGSMDGT